MKTIVVSSQESKSNVFESVYFYLLIFNIVASIYLLVGMYYSEGSYFFIFIFLAETVTYFIVKKMKFLRVLTAVLIFRALYMIFLNLMVSEAIIVTNQLREHQRINIQRQSIIKRVEEE